MFFCECVFLSRREGDTEDAIDELENEVEKLKKNERKRTELRNDLKQYQRRDSIH